MSSKKRNLFQSSPLLAQRNDGESTSTARLPVDGEVERVCLESGVLQHRASALSNSSRASDSGSRSRSSVLAQRRLTLMMLLSHAFFEMWRLS